MANFSWNIETIKEGITRFLAENDRLPTATDFDLTEYLPSARQVQRLYGGMAGLRKTLGYGEIDFTKGDLRKAIALKSFTDGLVAEESFEKVLIEKFGEPFVHTQKRYAKGTKNRYDFFIYAQNQYFGIDVFTTDRKEYIPPNVRHKIERYKTVSEIPVFFVVMGTSYTNVDIEKATSSLPSLYKYPLMKLMNEEQFLAYALQLHPLAIPENFKGIE